MQCRVLKQTGKYGENREKRFFVFDIWRVKRINLLETCSSVFTRVPSFRGPNAVSVPIGCYWLKSIFDEIAALNRKINARRPADGNERQKSISHCKPVTVKSERSSPTCKIWVVSKNDYNFRGRNAYRSSYFFAVKIGVWK